jgi:hypothetical protein
MATVRFKATVFKDAVPVFLAEHEYPLDPQTKFHVSKGDAVLVDPPAKGKADDKKKAE